MKRTIVITFKDGNKITVESPKNNFRYFDLKNEMTLDIINGTLYKSKGNVICGEDITETIYNIEISMKY